MSRWTSRALCAALAAWGASGACVEGACGAIRSEQVLLQRSGRRARSGEGVPLLQETVEVLGNVTRHLPLCHSAIVSESCWRVDGQGAGLSVRRSRLARFLSADAETMDRIWNHLRLPRGADVVECVALCEAVVENLRSSGAALPEASDLACYALRGSATCDVDVSPAELVRRLARAEDEALEDVVRIDPRPVAGGLVQRAISVGASGAVRAQERGVEAPVAGPRSAEARRSPKAGGPARGGAAAGSCPYSVSEVLVRIANVFRVYPSLGRGVSVASGAGPALLQGASSAAGEAVVAASDARARAWVSTVLSEMDSWRTAPFRAQWFGGAGDMSDDDVRDRVLRTMNFVERELMDGVHYVLPADHAVSSACTGNTIAYVWKWSATEDGYVETRGPTCSETDDPVSKHCGVDTEGRLYVYLCQRWLDGIDDNARTSTLVHEASHHAGPSDVSYDKALMKTLPQADQLNNAANYQHFAQAVAQSAWGCPDSDNVTGLPYTCDPPPCTCAAFAGLCGDAELGAKVRAQCPATCGSCAPPSTGAGSRPAPTPAPPACSEPQGKVLAGRYRATCLSFGHYRYCALAEVAQACPVTCGACSVAPSPTMAMAPRMPAPAPGGCDEPSEVVSAGRWRATCRSFGHYGYCREPGVAEACPATCGGACGAAAPVSLLPAPAPPTTAPSTTTTATAAPTTTPMLEGAGGGCYESPSKLVVGQLRATCASFRRYGYCADAAVRRACPVSCGACEPLPRCTDDTHFVVGTSKGDFHCEDWRGYECWDAVKPHCPSACNVSGCSRRVERLGNSP